MAGSTFRSEIRRALTFWRRSIQARVVASIVVLSAVVVVRGGLGPAPADPDRVCSTTGWTPCSVEVNTAVAEANRQLDGALTSSDPNEQQTALGNLLVKRGGSRGFRWC